MGLGVPSEMKFSAAISLLTSVTAAANESPKVVYYREMWLVIAVGYRWLPWHAAVLISYGRRESCWHQSETRTDTTGENLADAGNPAQWAACYPVYRADFPKAGYSSFRSVPHMQDSHIKHLGHKHSVRQSILPTGVILVKWKGGWKASWKHQATCKWKWYRESLSGKKDNNKNPAHFKNRGSSAKDSPGQLLSGAISCRSPAPPPARYVWGCSIRLHFL